MRSGYETDVLHYDDVETEITPDYRLVVAHVGPAISRIIKILPTSVPVIRYRQLAERRGIPDLQLPTRLLCPEEEQELDQRANLIASLGEMTTRMFQAAGLNATCIHNAAYVKPATDEEIARKVTAGRGFLYQGGSGCIQKGLDLLIEAFAQERDIHLYLDSIIEPDIFTVYRKELALPNIHFSRLLVRAERVRAHVESSCPFLILAGLNSGQSTAMVAGTARGRIPVVNANADIPWEAGVIRIDSSDVPSIRNAIRTAAGWPDQDLLAMSMATRNGFERFFTPEGFASAVDRILEGSDLV
jgi:hypothetical protein